MTRMTIVVDVDETDPAREDPEVIAEYVVDAYETDRRHGFEAPEVRLVSAEWAT